MAAVPQAGGFQQGESFEQARQAPGFFAFHGIWAPGVRLFRRLGFNAKASIISIVFVLPMLGLLLWQLSLQSSAAESDRMDATRQHVEVAYGVLVWAQGEEAAGRLSREQAQALARQAIATMRYDEREYFWINDMQPRVVMHPIKPELNGQDVSGTKDPNGLPLFKAFVAKVRESGKGFVAYQWPKPGSERPVDKISYVQGFEPWGWVIGSGIYVDDLRAATLRRASVSAAIVIAALLVSAYLFFCFYRVINGGLEETRRHLRAMTSGDLTTSPSPWGSDEAAELMMDLRAMQDSLRGMVRRVRASSEQILGSSTEIAGGAMDLSSRTEQAAASLEESAAAMTQIAATVHKTHEHTGSAAGVAERNAAVAMDGGRVMREMVDTMQAISASSNRIADIIGTIDGIAFQTNILALNAAVEAARAGEQGRGFAVVAGEVRALAQRSAQAAREIKSLISQSVEQVDHGNRLVEEAGQSMSSIVSQVQRVSDLIGEIATASQEQSRGIAQVGSAVTQLDQVTQQNAALVEQSTAAAESLQHQASRLAEMVSAFRTSH